MIETAGRLRFQVVMYGALDHAEHDRADKSDCDIRGNNAQSADESHGNAPWFTSLPAVTRKLANRSTPKKSALLPVPAVHCLEQPATWLKSREINALKSP